NVIDPNIAVITNIGLDHTDWLGDTIEKIAFEKAGIIRPHIPVIFAGEQSLPQAIQDKANSSQATLYAINRDYFY
ncbi:Mur ligase family protein, partial [Serratia marcescens]